MKWILVIRVKVTGTSNPAFSDVSQFTGSPSNLFRNIEFNSSDDTEEADFWIILEGSSAPKQRCKVPPENVYFLTLEPVWPTGFYSESKVRTRFLEQFARVYSCHETLHPNTINVPPFLPWMVNANHGPSILAPHDRDVNWLRDMQAPEKTKKLSVICSTQSWTIEHRQRLRFVEKLASHFGSDIDWFGNGIRPISTKWEGLADYEYTIALENKSQYNVITEKVQDPFLTYTFPIYWGAPNLGDYFPPESFLAIPIEDFNRAIASIESLISHDLTDKQLKALAAARNITLNEFMFLNRIANIVTENFVPNAAREVVNLNFPTWSDRLFDGNHGHLRNASANLLNKIETKLKS